MLTAVLAFFNMIPGLSSMITALTTAYFNSKVQLATIRVGGDVTIGKSLVTGIVAEGQVRVSFLQTVAQSKFLMFLVGGFALPIMLFNGKCIVWDTMLGLGVTHPITGQVGDYMSTILYGIFGMGSVMGVGHMYFNRDKTGE